MDLGLPRREGLRKLAGSHQGVLAGPSTVPQRQLGGHQRDGRHRSGQQDHRQGGRHPQDRRNRHPATVGAGESHLREEGILQGTAKLRPRQFRDSVQDAMGTHQQ